MSVKPLTGVKFREFDSNGNPLAGGLLYTYAAGTTTPLATYTDSTGNVANANPVVLDAAGRASVWLQPGQLYKFVLKDSTGVVQYTEDNFPVPVNASASDSSAAAEPGGRVSLTNGVAVDTTDATGAVTIYYIPYKSNLVPLYDGVNWALWAISQLSQSTADGTKSPTAVAANSNYDLFVWNDAGVIRLSRGPAWSSDTLRGNGIGTTELVRVSGRLANKNAITNGPGANLGLYVGTVRSDGSSQINDSKAHRHTWNMYNRVSRTMQVLEATSSWAYNTLTWRQANGAAANQLDFVIGSAEDQIEASVLGLIGVTGTTTAAQVGIGVDSTTTPSGLYGNIILNNVTLSLTAQYTGIPGQGRHYLAWLERALSGGGATWYGTSNGQTGIIGSILA